MSFADMAAAWRGRWASAIVLVVGSLSPALAGTAFLAANDPLIPNVTRVDPRSPIVVLSDAAFARAQLETAIRLFDREFRVESTGQYLDAIDLHAERQPPGISSIAATGIGLISLAMADALGIDRDAAAKAETTLSNLLNRDSKRPFYAARSKDGWFEQYLDARTGVAKADHKAHFSTIDTTLLTIGAVFAGRYFEAKHPPADSPAARVTRLSSDLLLSVAWPSAVRDLEAGRLHALFVGGEEAPLTSYWGEPFDEYVLIPCLGRYVDALVGRRSALSEYWDLHIKDVDRLPTRLYGAQKVLSRTRNEYVSHFTHQFAFYLCGELGQDPKFQQALATVHDADKQWFSRRGSGVPDRWWGLGGGSALVWSNKSRTSATELYVASSLASGVDDDVFSPAIMAGFLALDALHAARARHPIEHSPILADLRSLFLRGECLYRYHGLEFLWRCSANDPFKQVQFMQGVDFSTYMLGMSTLVPEIGLDFFRRYAP